MVTTVLVVVGIAVTVADIAVVVAVFALARPGTGGMLAEPGTRTCPPRRVLDGPQQHRPDGCRA